MSSTSVYLLSSVLDLEQCSNVCLISMMQALKALILERMGKPDEALSVCLNAKELLHTNDSILIDDLTLSTLQIVFQRLAHCQYMYYLTYVYTLVLS